MTAVAQHQQQQHTSHCFLDMRVSPDVVQLNTSEAFLKDCVGYLCDLSDIWRAVSARTVVFTDRPFGLFLRNDIVTQVSGTAERVGVQVGSALFGIEPAPNTGMAGDVLQHLHVCELPV